MGYVDILPPSPFQETILTPCRLIEDEEKLFNPVNGHLYGTGNFPHDPFEKEYFIRNTRTDANFQKMIDLNPAYLLIMHGSSYKGDCARALKRLCETIK